MFNWVDAAIIVLVLGFVGIGFWRGLIQTAIILLGIVAAIALSTRLGEFVGNLFSPLTPDENIQTIAGLAIIGIGTLTVVSSFLLFLTSRWPYWKDTVFFKINRRAGAFLGILVGWLVMSSLLNLAQFHPVASTEQDISSSTVGRLVAKVNALTIDQVVRLARIMPEDWFDHRNSLILAEPPSMYQPPLLPTELLHLAEHYAPVVFMDTAKPKPTADFITSWDYDDNQNPLDNWRNLGRDGVNLGGQVYYWVLETQDHWFIGYGFFHPRDWGGEGIDCTSDHEATTGCHENDMEGLLISVRRSDSTPYGEFLTLETISHGEILSFKDYDLSPSSQVPLSPGKCDDKVNCDVQFLEHDGRPYVYVEAKGHVVRGAVDGGLRWERNFPDGNGVLYFPTGAAQVPASGDDRTVGYQLVDINDLWSRRDQPSIFTKESGGLGGKFLGDDGTPPNAASPPWRWFDQHHPSVGSGVLFLDPACWINKEHSGLVPWPNNYLRRSYDLDPPPPKVC